MSIPEPKIVGPKDRGRFAYSLIWLVPIAALAISLGVVWKTYYDRGPLIEIAFLEATGIRTDETELRYRDVTIGLVEELEFSADLETVVAHIRVNKDIAPFIDAESQFWIVRPEVTTRGVTGLDTVLSGVFIQGTWDSEIGEEAERFTALLNPPLATTGEQGLHFTLYSTDGKGMVENTPILYRGIEVGRIGNLRLSGDGQSILADAFIPYPNDRLVNSATKFWDTSGFDLSFGPTGAQLNVSSLAALVAGGISFETIVSGGRKVGSNAAFQLYPDESEARSSVFTGPSREGELISIVFEGDVSGLAVGADVELRGVTVGEVTALTGIVDEQRFGDQRVRLLSTVTINPARLGIGADENVLDFLAEQVASGLRAQLTNASLLTGGLKIVLIEAPDAPPAELRRNADPYPQLPSIEADIADVSATAEGVFERINKLPIEDVLNSTISMMDSATRLLNSDGIKEVPDEALALLGDARKFVGSDEIQRLPGQFSDTMASLDLAIQDLRGIVTSVAEQEVIASLSDSVNAVQKAAEDASLSVAGLPELVDSANAFVRKTADLPLEALVTDAEALLQSLEGLTNQDSTREIPERLNTALGQLSDTLAQLRDGGLIENANSTFAATTRAAESVADASDSLPEVVARIERLLAQAEGTLAGFDSNAPLTSDARATLREIRNAASSVSSLARAIERRPNSLLIGR